MTRCGCWASKVFKSVNFASFGGYSFGCDNARNMAAKREMHSTCRVCGYEAVKMGSNIAARYSESSGDVKDEAIISHGSGTRPSCFFAREPFFTPSICKSIHHTPGIPSIIQRMAFLTSEPSGNHCRTTKYAKDTVTKKGSLNRNRNICMMMYTPAGSEGTGRNGAIPEPGVDALATAAYWGCLGSANLGRETGSTSPYREDK